MTPPIRIRRRQIPDYDNPNGWFRPQWVWFCRYHNITDRTGGGLTATHAEALAAGLAHLATHTETR